MSAWEVRAVLRRRVGSLANGTRVAVVCWSEEILSERAEVKPVLGNRLPVWCPLADLHEWTVEPSPDPATVLAWAEQVEAERFAFGLEVKAIEARRQLAAGAGTGRLPRRPGR